MLGYENAYIGIQHSGTIYWAYLQYQILPRAYIYMYIIICIYTFTVHVSMEPWSIHVCMHNRKLKKTDDWHMSTTKAAHATLISETHAHTHIVKWLIISIP
jgi:hypothetical protein